MTTTSIIDQIMALEAQKQQLMSQAKTEALKAAEKAVADLNNLGFHYRLVEDANSSTVAHSGTTRVRRGGVSDQVLELIKSAPAGLTSASVQDQLGAHEKAAKQSIANALSNLKKKGLLTAKDGVYHAA